MELFPQNKIIVGMVGLPGTGKTFIAKKVARYMEWLGNKTEVFNICHYRRDMFGENEFTAEFFDPEIAENAKKNNECAEKAFKDMVKFLEQGGDVAVFDGVNETIEKRREIRRSLDVAFKNFTLIWVESVCNDEHTVEDNIRIQVSNPDYKDMDVNAITADYKNRIENYRKKYQELSKENDGENASFIKLFDFGSQVLVNNVSGYIGSKIISLLMHIHNKPRPIYFSRHGESLNNTEDKVGGDPDLSERGYAYSKLLNQFVQEEMKQRKITKNTKIYSSTLRRTIITAGAIDVGIRPVPLKILNELYCGSFEGMSYGEIEEKYPNEANDRKTDKLRYRYPGGESYLDVIQRLEPIIFAIEKSRDPVIIVAHQAIIRCLYAYFCKHELEEIPHLSVPLHTVIKLVPDVYHANEYRYNLERRNRQSFYQKRSF